MQKNAQKDMGDHDSMKLTDIEFWNDYWSRVQVPVEVDLDFSFERCLGNKLKEVLKGKEGQSLEIGCAPGKWMVFLSNHIGLQPSGIEYSPIGVDATKRNMDRLNLKYGFVQDGDFFSIKPEPIFDVVMSFGFIEHFDDPSEVILRHLQWLKKGGLLIIGVPNFRGIYHEIQEIYDKSILEKHNLNVMCKEYFEQIAEKYDLHTCQIDYLGSFEPALPIANGRIKNGKQFFVRVIMKILRVIRKLKCWDNINHPLISSYILASYIKR